MVVAGVDPSGITLRPFDGTRHERWQACGLASLDAIEKTLTDLVAEVDHRLEAMPRGLDILPIGPNAPLVLAVLEEGPATLRALDAADTKQGSGSGP